MLRLAGHHYILAVDDNLSKFYEPGCCTLMKLYFPYLRDTSTSCSFLNKRASSRLLILKNIVTIHVTIHIVQSFSVHTLSMRQK